MTFRYVRIFYIKSPNTITIRGLDHTETEKTHLQSSKETFKQYVCGLPKFTKQCEAPLSPLLSPYRVVFLRLLHVVRSSEKERKKLEYIARIRIIQPHLL